MIRISPHGINKQKSKQHTFSTRIPYFLFNAVMWSPNAFATVCTQIIFTRQSRESQLYLGLLRVSATPVCRPGYKYDGESSLQHLTYSPRVFGLWTRSARRSFRHCCCCCCCCCCCSEQRESDGVKATRRHVRPNYNHDQRRNL